MTRTKKLDKLNRLVKVFLVLMALSGLELGSGYYGLISINPFTSIASQAIYGMSEIIFGIGLIVAYLAILSVACESSGRGYKHESDPGFAFGLMFLIVPIYGAGIAWEGFSLIWGLVT